MKVLIITYYWPPAGGGGVQRWLHFAKYLRDFGVEPIIFTIDNPNYPIEDKSLANHIPNGIEVIRQKIWEPNTFFGKKSKGTAAGFLQEDPSLLQKFALYIRANYFIPDARKFWIKPSVKTIKTYLDANPVAWIITTGPPHSVHLIGKAIKKQTNIKWLADFRDPWTKIDYFYQLPLQKKSLEKHLKLEKEVLNKADKVIVVSPYMQQDFLKTNTNTTVITNGYDAAISTNKNRDTTFSLVHVGMLNSDRNPIIFWEAVKELISENIAFKNALDIKLIGKIAEEVKASIQENQLGKYVTEITYIPHNKIHKHQERSQVLLLFVNNVPHADGIVTGKVFEYLRAKRPILAIAPEKGDLAAILNQTKAGSVVGFENKSALKKQLLINFELFRKGALEIDSENISQFHRRNLTEKLVNLLR